MDNSCCLISDNEFSTGQKELICQYRRRLLQNYTQSLNQLHGLADKLGMTMQPGKWRVVRRRLLYQLQTYLFINKGRGIFITG